MTPEEKGMERLGRAQKIIDLYREDTGTDEETALTDLLTDLRHWAYGSDQDFDEARDRSERHFDAEIEEYHQQLIAEGEAELEMDEEDGGDES